MFSRTCGTYQLNTEAKESTLTTQKEDIMANFPRPEADIKVLAQNIITGLPDEANLPPQSLCW
jgi:hypothetical protein